METASLSPADLGQRRGLFKSAMWSPVWGGGGGGAGTSLSLLYIRLKGPRAEVLCPSGAHTLGRKSFPCLHTALPSPQPENLQGSGLPHCYNKQP